MRKPRHLIAATLLGSLALGAALPANAHGGEGRGWGERHHHHHRDRYRDAKRFEPRLSSWPRSVEALIPR